MNSDREVIEEGKPLSGTRVWPLLEQYFVEKGPAAWPETPHYPTSNAFVANTFAELLVAFLRDSTSRLDPSEPVYILELAAGSGAFSVFCIRALEEKRKHFATLAALDLRYVQTDLTEKNLARWAQDEHLQRGHAKGLLDAALFWPERDTTVTLRRRGVTLAPGTLKNPLLVIANYFFDVIRQDYFRTDHGALHEARVTLWRRPTDAPLTLDQVKLEGHYVEVDDRHYPSPAWNALLAHYRESLPVGSILFPVGALRTLDNLLALSGGNLLLLSIDKGWHSTAFMEGHHEVPYTPHTGSCSFAVNFHALGRYLESLGGRVWRARESAILTTFAAVSHPGSWENLGHAAHQHLEVTDLPKNINTLVELLYKFTPLDTCDDATLLGLGMACVQLAHCDPWMFECCAPYLERGLPHRDAGSEAELRAVLKAVESNLSPLVVGCFPAIRRLCHLTLLLDDLDHCHALNERALALFGPHAGYWFCRGALAERRGDLDDALQQHRSALALDPGHEQSRAALQRLGGAEAVDRFCYVRGGVVGWREHAIVIPAAPGLGTSTLVAALVRRGAREYSDSWAVFDEDGRVHPFVRDAGRDDAGPVDLPPLPVAFMVATVYRPGSTWEPVILEGTRARLLLLQNAAGMHEQPARMMRLAATLDRRVVALESPRPDADVVAPAILEFADAVIDGRLPHFTSVRRSGATGWVARAARAASDAFARERAGQAAYVRIEHFLPADAHRQVLDFALAREKDFTESELYNEAAPEKVDLHFRRSRTLYQLDDEVWNLFAPRLTALLPHVRRELGIPWFRVGDVERQLHVHRGGDFFHRHSDGGEGEVATRRVSGVYYFHQEPKRFDGGALYLYDRLGLGEGHEGGPSCIALEPLDNSLVFFPSDTFHEVQPVRLRDSAFSAGRFTVTFWFREDTRWQPTVLPRSHPATVRPS